MESTFDFPGFVPATSAHCSAVASGPVHWAALSGDPAKVHLQDQTPKDQRTDPGRRPPAQLLRTWLASASASRACRHGICWVGLGQHVPGWAWRSNEMVRSGAAVTPPRVIGRDHLDSGSVASPEDRETSQRRGRLRRCVRFGHCSRRSNTRAAPPGSRYYGGGGSMGFSQHPGMVIVCDVLTESGHDGCPRAARPATGVMRHADGPTRSRYRLRQGGLNLPMIK